jgi:hypothetical protein
VTRYDHANDAWISPQYPDTTGMLLVPFPALSVNWSGEALIVDPVAANAPGLYAQHYSGGSGGRWTQETILSASDYYFDARVYLTDAGVAVAAVEGRGGIAVATRSGSTWTMAPVSSSTGVITRNVAVMANAAGDVLVAGEQGTSTGLLHPTTYQYDASRHVWSGPTLLSAETEPAAGDNIQPCPYGLSLTAGGDAVIARCWNGPFSDGPTTIEAYTYTKSSGLWSAVQNASAPGYASITTLAFDSAGVGFAAYINAGNDASATGPVEINPFAIGTGWGPQSAPENPDAGLSGPPRNSISFIAPNGAGWVAWSDDRSTFVRKVL